jgi:hypothetical protein
LAILESVLVYWEEAPLPSLQYILCLSMGTTSKCHFSLGLPCGSPKIGILVVATLLWGKCEDETHTPKSGNLKSFGTPETSEFNCRGQNTSPWGVLYTVGKVFKFRYRKWPCMSHLDICNTSYGQKKGRESNW